MWSNKRKVGSGKRFLFALISLVFWIIHLWQPQRMSRRSWAAVTDFKRRVFRLKPDVQILGSSKSIRHTKVEILPLKSCFLCKKETKLNANLWKAFSTELFCRRSWWFHVVLLNELQLARKARPRSSSARPAMPFVNQERLVLKFPNRELKHQRFWATYVNRKWVFFSFNILWRHQICIAKSLYYYRDDLPKRLFKITAQECKKTTSGWRASLKNVAV